MDLLTLLSDLMVKYPQITMVLSALGSLVILGQVYVAITPSKDDDAWYAKLEAIPVLGQLLVVIKSFSPIQRKDK